MSSAYKSGEYPVLGQCGPNVGPTPPFQANTRFPDEQRGGGWRRTSCCPPHSHTGHTQPHSGHFQCVGCCAALKSGSLHLSSRWGGGWGGGVLKKSESTNSDATKPVPFLKKERINYAGLAKVAHEKQWTVAVISWKTFPAHPPALLSAPL